MSPASAPVEQPVAEHERAERQRGLAAGRFSVGRAIRSHSAATARGRLAVRGEPLAERDLVERRIVGVQARERERRARGAGALGEVRCG